MWIQWENLYSYLERYVLATYAREEDMSPVMEDKAALKHILVLAPFDLGILKLGWKIVSSTSTLASHPECCAYLHYFNHRFEENIPRRWSETAREHLSVK